MGTKNKPQKEDPTERLMANQIVKDSNEAAKTSVKVEDEIGHRGLLVSIQNKLDNAAPEFVKNHKGTGNNNLHTIWGVAACYGYRTALEDNDQQISLLQQKEDKLKELPKLIRQYWSFDNNQQPTASYHDREHFIELIEKIIDPK